MPLLKLAGVDVNSPDKPILLFVVLARSVEIIMTFSYWFERLK